MKWKSRHQRGRLKRDDKMIPNEISEDKAKYNKKHLIYEVKMGYSYPIGNSWNLNFWVGYNSFDFAVVEPSVVDFKSSTPLQLGVGFSYFLRRR